VSGKGGMAQLASSPNVVLLNHKSSILLKVSCGAPHLLLHCLLLSTAVHYYLLLSAVYRCLLLFAAV
jgi:hypothetical protein